MSTAGDRRSDQRFVRRECERRKIRSGRFRCSQCDRALIITYSVAAAPTSKVGNAVCGGGECDRCAVGEGFAAIIATRNACTAHRTTAITCLDDGKLEAARRHGNVDSPLIADDPYTCILASVRK